MLRAPVEAEELGLTRATVTAALRSGDPTTRRFLGAWGWSAVGGAAAALIASLAVSLPVWSVPRLRAFNFVGGLTLSPELAALLGALVLHHGAHISEVVRGAVLAVPRGQRDAAAALGLRWWPAMRLVILPQALRIVIPSFISIAVGFFQDASLLVVIGLFDLLNTARVAAQDPAWLGFHNEAYVFVALLYFAGSAALSRYGLWLEGRLTPGARRR